MPNIQGSTWGNEEICKPIFCIKDYYSKDDKKYLYLKGKRYIGSFGPGGCCQIWPPLKQLIGLQRPEVQHLYIPLMRNDINFVIFTFRKKEIFYKYFIEYSDYLDDKINDVLKGF